jgi:hypothetical protein
LTVSVGNLEPGQDVQIELQYVAELTVDGSGAVRFVLPVSMYPKYELDHSGPAPAPVPSFPISMPVQLPGGMPFSQPPPAMLPMPVVDATQPKYTRKSAYTTNIRVSRVCVVLPSWPC